MARPNILWIVTTQWRAQALGSAGDVNARTPWLDRLAAESVNFTQAVTPHPFGPFARAALLTGVPSPANGVRDYFDGLPEGARTLAHDLGARGYATAFFGKWHLGRRDPAIPLVGRAAATTVVPPEGRGGFGFWEGFDGGFLLNDPWLHGTRFLAPTQFHGYQSDVLCGRAAEWIGRGTMHNDLGPWSDEPAGPPWFCLVSLEAPHPPYDAPAAGVPARDPGDLSLPANVPRGGAVEIRARRELAGYYAHIEATDRAVGRLTEALPRAGGPGHRPNLVVFTSVHGDMHGAHGRFRKGWPHEESVRVPLLVRLPTEGGAPRQGDKAAASGSAGGSRKAEPPGARCDDAISLLDLPAMTRAWADGAATVGATHPTVANISMPSLVRLPLQCDRVWRGVRTRTRKLVLSAGPSAEPGEGGSPWLFFDLEQDPGEEANLARNPARKSEMAALLESAGLR